MTSDRDLIRLARLTLRSGAAADEVVRSEAANSYWSLSKKAWWSWVETEKVLDAKDHKRSSLTRLSEREFRIKWISSWISYFVNAARVSEGTPCGVAAIWGDTTQLASANVYICWHHPSWPFAASALSQMGAQLMVAEETEWLTSAIPEDKILKFRTPTGIRKTVELFQRGGPVAAMLDYCYADTSAVAHVPFLGKPSRTPIGLLRLANRYGYAISIVEMNDLARTPEIVAHVGPNRMPERELAIVVNEALSRAILADPEEWLLWPSLDRRWVP